MSAHYNIKCNYKRTQKYDILKYKYKYTLIQHIRYDIKVIKQLGTCCCRKITNFWSRHCSIDYFILQNTPLCFT